MMVTSIGVYSFPPANVLPPVKTIFHRLGCSIPPHSRLRIRRPLVGKGLESTPQYFVLAATGEPIGSPLPDYELWEGSNMKYPLFLVTPCRMRSLERALERTSQGRRNCGIRGAWVILVRAASGMRSVFFDVPIRPRLE